MNELIPYITLATAVDALIQATALLDGDADPKARRDALRRARAAHAQLSMWLER